MRAYTQLLVKTCQKRKAQPIGGMAAYIPNRKDPIINETAIEKVREDKKREINDGFVGTWVAHPDLVSVAKEIFNSDTEGKISKNSDIKISSDNLLDFSIPNGKITEEGLRSNLRICLIYFESWLRGTGAVAINNLMEDAATAEISRSQVWQWLHNQNSKFENDQPITFQIYQRILSEEFDKVKNTPGKFVQAKALIEKLIQQNGFEEFFTTVAYKTDLE
jgi:malate synthase